MIRIKPTYDRLRKVSLIKYGNYYNFVAATHAKIAPAGWSVPLVADWNTLHNYIGANLNVSPDDFGVANHLKHRRQVDSPLGGAFATSTNPRWDSNATHYGRDSVLFGALPSGYKFETSGTSVGVNQVVRIWASDVGGGTNATGFQYSNNSGDVSSFASQTNRGFVIKCFRAAAAWEQTLTDGTHRGQVTDIDGNIYDTVKIGTQVWFVQYLATTRLNDGTPLTNIGTSPVGLVNPEFAYISNDVNVSFYTSHLHSIWKPKDFIKE